MSKKWNIVDLTRLRVNKSCTLRFFYVERKTSTTLILRKKIMAKNELLEPMYSLSDTFAVPAVFIGIFLADRVR